MAEQFIGKFKLTESEGFEEYMKELGVGFALRKIGNQVKPVVEVSIDGEDWTITSTSTFKTVVVKFKLGQEFEDTTPDGRKVKSLFTLSDDGKLTLKETATKAGEKDSVCVRYIKDGNMHVDLECNGVKCTRVYVRE